MNYIWSRPIAVTLLLVSGWIRHVRMAQFWPFMLGVIQGKLLGKFFLFIKKSYKEETIPLLNLVMFHVTPGNLAATLQSQGVLAWRPEPTEQRDGKNLGP